MVEDQVEVVIQVSGKTRSRDLVLCDAVQREALATAQEDANVANATVCPLLLSQTRPKSARFPPIV